MKRWSELDSWIDQRWDPLADAILDLAAACGGSEAKAAAAAAAYLAHHPVDDLEIVELDDGTPVVFGQRIRTFGAPNVLVLGVYHARPPAPVSTDNEERRIFADNEGLVGPGVSSRFGGMVAQVEGFFGIMSERDGSAPINAQFLLVPERLLHDDLLTAALQAVPLAALEAVIATSGTSWDLTAPTITVGSRGHLLMDIAIKGGVDLDAATFAGSARNPLANLVEILAQLRESNGRIAIPGFYHRALPASSGARAALHPDGYDPSRWQRGSGAVAFEGGPSPLERSSLWPTVDVLSIDAGTGPRVADLTIPGTASARVLFELVPAQRPEEIDIALRSWLEDRVRPGFTLETSVRREADPHQSDPTHPALAAQVRAVKRVLGGRPVFVPSGGMPHMSVVERLTGAAVLYAGLGSPASHANTDRERLLTSRLTAGTNVAGELLSQLGRPRKFLG